MTDAKTDGLTRRGVRTLETAQGRIFFRFKMAKEDERKVGGLVRGEKRGCFLSTHLKEVEEFCHLTEDQHAVLRRLQSRQQNVQHCEFAAATNEALIRWQQKPTVTRDKCRLMDCHMPLTRPSNSYPPISFCLLLLML